MIVVDSNVWIFAESEDAPEHSAAVRKLQHFLPNGVATNAIVVSEVFHKLSNERFGIGSGLAGQRIEEILRHPSVHWMPFKRETAEQALVLAAESPLKINDALIAQQALELNAPVLTDNVKDFRKVEGLKVVAL